MLDRLPTELLVEVLDLVSLFKFEDRYSTLYACRLVSKSISAVAKPALWRRIDRKEEEDIDSLVFRARSSGMEKQTHELAFFGHMYETLPKLPVLIQTFSQLSKVSLHAVRSGLMRRDALAMSALSCTFVSLYPKLPLIDRST
jgi:hypothetical protein